MPSEGRTSTTVSPTPPYYSVRKSENPMRTYRHFFLSFEPSPNSRKSLLFGETSLLSSLQGAMPPSHARMFWDWFASFCALCLTGSCLIFSEPYNTRQTWQVNQYQRWNSDAILLPSWLGLFFLPQTLF